MSLFERSATLYLNRNFYDDSSSKLADMDSYRAAFDPARYNFSRSVVKSPSLNFSRKTTSNMANGSIIADNNGVTLTSISSSPLSTTNLRSSINFANKLSDSDTLDQSSSSRSRFGRMITTSKPPLPSIESSIRGGTSSSAPYRKSSPSSTFYDYRSSSSTLPAASSSSRRYASVERRVPITLASYDASLTDNSSTSNRYDYRGVDSLSRRFENAMSSTAAALASRSRSTQGRQRTAVEERADAAQLERATRTADEIRESPATVSTHHNHKSSVTSAPPTALYRVKKVAFSVPDVPSYVRNVNIVRENESANEQNQKRGSTNQLTTDESPTSTPISILKTSKSATLNVSTTANNNSNNNEMNDESSRRIRSNSNSMINMIASRKNDLLEKDSTDKLGLVGLRNLGNTCFMNSVLQCLSHSKLLREYCFNNRLSNEISSSSRMKGMLIKAFNELLNELWSPKNAGPPSYINPEKFKLQIQKFAPRFTGYSQQDAQEFLRYLLQGLHEDVNTVVGNPGNAMYSSNQENEQEKAKEAWRRYLTMDDSKIVDIFVGQLKSELKCTSCGHVSTTYDPFWDLSLPIPQQQSSSNGYSSSSYSRQSSTVTLADCMDAFTKEEILDGDEKPTCEKCKTRRKCTKKFSIQRFPPILVLHLKRFSGERYRSRLSTLIQFPVTKFDLSAYVQKSGNGPAPRYDLYAVSNHTGTPLMGHYTAYCKRGNSDRPWYLFDDTRVVSVNESCVVSSEAYVLFYEIINDSADVNGNSSSNYKSTVNGFLDRKNSKFCNSNNSSSSGTLLSRF